MTSSSTSSRNRDDRRAFLRSAFGLAVFTVTSPRVLLGRIVPTSVTRINELQISATYVIDLNDPRWECTLLPNGRKAGLTEVGCSVRLEDSIDELAMNPDHCKWSGLKRGEPFPIAVTRVKMTGTDAFAAVSAWCPHNDGGTVFFDHGVGNNGLGLYVCGHENSCFTVDGVWVPPDVSPYPDAPQADQFAIQQNLNTFPCIYDEGSNTVTIFNVLTDCVTSVEDVVEAYALHQNSPNPVRVATQIPISLPAPAHVKLDLLALDGKVIAQLLDQRLEAGRYVHELHARDLAPGTYIYRLDTPFGVKTRKMVVVK